MKDFQNRIERMAKHYAKWARRRNIKAYRIYDRDIPQYPFSIDVYEDHLLINEFYNKNIASKGDYESWRRAAIELISQTLHTPSSRTHIKTRQPGKNQYSKLAQTGEFMEVGEADLKFLVNLNDYLDTGLFLDHRQTREMIREKIRDLRFEEPMEGNTKPGELKVHEAASDNSKDDAKGRGPRFLNLFSYTGAFSIYAASGGASEIVNVDTSQVYLDWFDKNLEVNKLESIAHQNICQDSREFLSDYDGPAFDVIFCDPPVFSSGKKHSRDFDVLRDHPDLINACLSHLSVNGVLYFSTNFRKFKLQWKPDSLATSNHTQSRKEFKVKEITAATLPEDFRNKKIHVCYEFQIKSK